MDSMLESITLKINVLRTQSLVLLIIPQFIINILKKITVMSMKNNTNNGKENILSNGQKNNLHSDPKQRLSKEQLINLRKNNLRQTQQIAFEKQQEIEELKAQFLKEKEQLKAKYESIIQEKDQYIKQLEEMCAMTTAQSRSQSVEEIQKPVTIKMKSQENGQKFFLSNTLCLHQAPLYEDLCYSIERPPAQNNKNGNFMNSRSIKARLLSSEKPSSKSFEYKVDKTSRRTSSSRHKLVPAQQPSFKKIL